MDRQIVYPGSIPLDTDILSIQRNTMVALGYIAQAALGTTTLVDGLVCSPSVPASLVVTVGPGSITSLSVIDALPFGSLPADTNDPLVKMGITTGGTSFTLSPPASSGQSVNYLIQASLSETDADPVVLPYYNAANPAQPFSGAQNNGTPQNTQRVQRVQLQLKPSPPANAGTQVTPAVDSGWTGLYVVTINYGQSQITPENIAVFAGAPFIAFKLNRLTPGFSRMTTFTSSGTFTVPNGSSSLKVRLCGGGGGGGAGFGGQTNLAGGCGSDGNAGNLIFTGNGGASCFGGGGRASFGGSNPLQMGQAPGSGGGGCYSVDGNGGDGAAGIVVVEY